MTPAPKRLSRAGILRALQRLELLRVPPEFDEVKLEAFEAVLLRAGVNEFELNEAVLYVLATEVFFPPPAVIVERAKLERARRHRVIETKAREQGVDAPKATPVSTVNVVEMWERRKGEGSSGGADGAPSGENGGPSDRGNVDEPPAGDVGAYAS